MKITILGAGGNIGTRISKEAATRNHELTLITSKSLSHFNFENNTAVKTEQADIFDTNKLETIFKNSDVVISAYAPPANNNDILTEASKSLAEAAKKANVRLITVGGAGSLQVDENTLLIDAPSFPEEYKLVAKAHIDALNTVFRPESELNWTNVSPSAYIFEGERTNNFRVGENHLLANDKGESAISMEDFAVGILNEVDDAKFVQKRFTIGY